MVSAQAYLDLQESFLVVISLLGSFLLKIVKAQAYLDSHGIRRSHRTSFTCFYWGKWFKLMDNDDKWILGLLYRSVPYVQTNIMSSVSDPQQVRSISKLQPFLQHFSNIWGRTVRSLAPCGHHPVPATPASHALCKGRRWNRALRFAQKGTRCAAMPTVWWSCHCVVDAVTAQWQHHRLHGASELLQWTYLQWTYYDQFCGWWMLGMLNDVEWCWMMFNDV